MDIETTFSAKHKILYLRCYGQAFANPLNIFFELFCTSLDPKWFALYSSVLFLIFLLKEVFADCQTIKGCDDNTEGANSFLRPGVL